MQNHRSSTLSIMLFVLLTTPLARAQNFPIALPRPTDADADTAPADPNAKLPQYDVVSVKENKSVNGMMSIGETPDGFKCINISLNTLIADAYSIRQDLISGGPGWVNSDGFDVQAKVAAEDIAAYKKLTWKQRNSLLQAVLADRFHLKVQQETKVLPIYDLVPAKGGSKLKPAAPITASSETDKPSDAPTMRGSITVGPGMFKAQDITLKSLADNLSGIVQHTVVDKTGLIGEVDIDLKWAPDEPAPATADTGADPGVSIFTAVQEQLGLKLQPTKGPTDIIIIEHAELPTQN